MRTHGGGLLALTVEMDGARCRLRLGGELDVTGVGEVDRTLAEIDLDALECLVLDLEEIVFMDLAGLRVILRAHKLGRHRGFDLEVIRPRGAAGRIFTLTPLARELRLVDAA